MELSVKEFSELVGLMLEARSEAWRSAESAAGANAREVTPVPLSAQSGTRVVIDTAEIQRVVAEAVDAEREAIAVWLANYAMAFPEEQRAAVVGAVEVVRQRVGRR